METRLTALLGLSGLALVALVSAPAADQVKVMLPGTVALSADYFGAFGCTMNCTNVDNPRDSYNYTSEYIENNDIVEFQNVGTAISNIDLSLVSIPDNNLVGDTVTISNGIETGSYNATRDFYALLQNNTSGSTYPYSPHVDISDRYGRSGDALTTYTAPFSLTESVVSDGASLWFGCQAEAVKSVTASSMCQIFK